MESYEETESSLKWEYFPIELLCLIFTKLDPKSLVKCMYVCRSWNSTALYTAEKNNRWEKMVSEFIVDRGQRLKMKSLNMSWKDLFINSVLWSHCDKAQLSVQKAINYKMSTINHIHIYKDNLIIVTSSNVKYFDLTKSEFKRCIEIQCIDFVENDKIIMIVTLGTENCRTLHLYRKRNSDDFNILESNEEVLDKVFQYRLVAEGCYVFDDRALLSLHKPKDDNWEVKYLARYYGGYKEYYIHVFQDKPYILSKFSRIYCVNEQSGFDGMLNVRCPGEDPTGIFVGMFHKFGVARRVEASKEFEFIRKNINGDNVFIMQCPDLTCVREHGEMLILGYSDGKIEFFIPREKYEKSALKRQYNITESTGNNLYDTHVISIDVYEERNQHHVFVATKTQVHHLLLKHTDISDYIWSVYPDRISLSGPL